MRQEKSTLSTSYKAGKGCNTVGYISISRSLKFTKLLALIFYSIFLIGFLILFLNGLALLNRPNLLRRGS